MPFQQPAQQSTHPYIDDDIFHADVAYLEQRWQLHHMGKRDVPIIDVGQGQPLLFVPILEHLEFVYARQIRALSQSRRVLLYRRRETRSRSISMSERVEELRAVLDSLQLAQPDLIAHGDAAMVMLEFAIRYPQRCRSLCIIAQGADYQIAPHPFIWILHELLIRLPVERLVPPALLRRSVINYIMARQPDNATLPRLPRYLIDEQFQRIALWPSVYKYSVLPVIHNFDIRARLAPLVMPILIINRSDDALSPLEKTTWLANHLPQHASHAIVNGGERFFLYSQAAAVTPLIEAFLQTAAIASQTT